LHAAQYGAPLFRTAHRQLPSSATLKAMPFPRLIAVDMDGTLLHSHGHVTPRNIAALRLAESADVEVVVATGRRHSYAMRILRELNLPHTHALISSNGTVIRTIGAELIHRTHMPLTTARWLCEHVSDFRNTLVLTFDTTSPTGDDAQDALVCEHLDDLHASIDRWMDSNAPYISQVPRLEDALLAEPPIQVMLCGTIARMAEAEARLLEDPRITPVGGATRPNAEITLHRTQYPERDLSIVDILPAGCSKASALAHLTHLRGFTMDDVLAIGDNWNDVPMLEAAGRAALMANAPVDLHQLARERHWAIAPANDDDGVAITIEEALATIAA
jgi:hydroxymethylpyrimidine pyrophosphatase-like HAD family hydrolase